MSWTYNQTTGSLFDPAEELRGKGYSGYPPNQNNPDAQGIPNEGPIPQGLWQAVELIMESNHGPYAIRLEPYDGTVTFGRSGFLMHGDSIAMPGYASEGCIIMARDIREMFWRSTDHDLEVVSGLPVYAQENL
jgi:type VI secretion system (T6SS) effector TldE1-like protein